MLPKPTRKGRQPSCFARVLSGLFVVVTRAVALMDASVTLKILHRSKSILSSSFPGTGAYFRTWLSQDCVPGAPAPASCLLCFSWTGAPLPQCSRCRAFKVASLSSSRIMDERDLSSVPDEDLLGETSCVR